MNKYTVMLTNGKEIEVESYAPVVQDGALYFPGEGEKVKAIVAAGAWSVVGIRKVIPAP